ncbi:MAG: hypothetical protein BWY74_00962 [Firmicutes bacterium ADurb.Bin419]|nr:MAG: hypothetical protein BWY74_00962 [Firmicutes bacterium ADurb.Bin419]
MFYIEFKTLDSQSIMAGYTAGSNTATVNTGTADSITKTGSPNSNTSGTNAMKYRGIENLWGNPWQIVDGINIKDHVAYVSRDASKYTSDKFDESYKKVGYTNSNANGYVEELGYDSNYPYVNLPISTVSAHDTSIYKDYYYQYSGNRIALVGGDWYHSNYAGISYWYLYVVSSYTGTTVGSRLVKVPIE